MRRGSTLGRVTDLPRIGIIGAGVMAADHAAAWRAVGHPPVALHVRGAVRAAPEALAGAAMLLDLDEFLAAVDVVDICTPTDTHPALALAAARAGKDAACEKPLALGGDAARTVVDAFAAARRVLQVGHFLRFHPAYRRLVELVHEGEIGTPIAHRSSRMSSSPFEGRAWLADPARSGGVITDLMIHDVDLALWLGGPAREVDACLAGAHGRTAFALLRHDELTSRLEASWDEPAFTFRTHAAVIGTAGAVGYDAISGRGVLRRSGRDDLIWAAEPVPAIDVFRAEAENLLALRRADPDALATTGLAVRAVQTVEAARQSAER